VKSVKEREHRRYAHEAAVTCQVADKRFEGRTRNVSRGGLCADLADKIAIGTDLMVDLKLVFEDEAQSDALRLPALVVWCTTVDDTHQIGLAFRLLSAEIAQHLDTFLRYLDDARTEKSPRAANVDDRFR
jgi:hypothetical protein